MRTKLLIALLAATGPVLQLAAQTVESGPKTYPVGTTIAPASGSVTTLTTSGDVTVPSGADVTYRATEQIRLEPGFSVLSGGIFRTQYVAGTAPTITSANSATFAVGQAGQFTVQAAGTIPMTYGYSGTLPSWATLNTATGVLSGTPPNTTGSPFTFVLTATNSAGTATQNFTVTVGIPPTISAQPTSQTALMGNAATFSVSASGTGPFTYQWRFNGSAISGATNASYTIYNVQPSHAGSYSVVVTGSGGTVTSANATLTVPDPVNDITWNSFDYQDVAIAFDPANPLVTWATLHVVNSGTKPWTTGSNYRLNVAITDSNGTVVNTAFGDLNGLTSTPCGGTDQPFFSFFWPSTPGYYTFTFTAYEGSTPFGTTFSKTIQVLAPTNWMLRFIYPVVSSVAHITAKVGQPVTYQPTTNEDIVTYFGSSGSYGFAWVLPAPMVVNSFSFSSTTGAVSFTPTTVGNYFFNLNGRSGQMVGPYQTVMVEVIDSIATPPVVTNTSITIPVNGSVSTTIQATNSPATFDANLLPGMSRSNALIYGTPNVSAGTYTVGISARNAGGIGCGTLTINVVNTGSPPAITSPTSASGTVGSAFSYQIAATNAPTSFNATNLPAGLSVNTSTGVISGTPTSAGTTSITISASNASGTGSATLTLTVGTVPAPVITSSTSASGTVGTAFSYQITATNTPTSYSASGLPAGVTINTSTGAIAGTPTSSGSYTVTLGAANAGGTGTATLLLTIDSTPPPPPTITSATTASGVVGTAFSYQITATNTPTSYSASGLPAGLSINTSTGAITGTPTTSGSYTVTLGATNAGGTGTATLTLTISSASSPTITSATTASGAVGTAFSYQIVATSSPSSYGASGLPAGLSVSASTGLISGTPATAGTSSVTISATNAAGTGTATLTLTIGGEAQNDTDNQNQLKIHLPLP